MYLLAVIILCASALAFLCLTMLYVGAYDATGDIIYLNAVIRFGTTTGIILIILCIVCLAIYLSKKKKNINEGYVRVSEISEQEEDAQILPDDVIQDNMV